MAQSEVSFDATGPTFVAFETTGSSLPAYGVGVYGIENGVRGVAGTKIINELAASGGSSGVTRDLVQTGVGVQGVGDSAGVRGDSEDTGVRGKGGVGVFGEGGYGVAGRGKYIGVLAAGDIAVRAEGDSIGTYSMAPTAVRAEGSVVGVLASGEGNGVGVKSRSPNNRAGVFMTDYSSPDVDFADFPIRDGESAPQICLAAGSARGTDQDILPSMGVAGDMVAFTRRRGDNVQAELWFCTRTNDDGNGAWWAKVQLGPTVIVT